MIDQEFSEWLRANMDHFRSGYPGENTGYTAYEIALVARAAGFEIGRTWEEIAKTVARIERITKLWDGPFWASWVSVSLCQWGIEWEEV